MRKSWIAIATVLTIGFVLTGCAKPPQPEIDAAKAALAQAVQAEAGKYASDALNAAEEAMKAVDQELQTQADKFALLRSYKKTTELLAAAKDKAAAAQQAAVEGKAKARSEAEAALAAARTAVESAQTELTSLSECKRQPKGFQADLDALRGMVEGLAGELPGIESSLGSEDFFGAKAAAETLSQRAQPILTDIAAAKERLNC